MSYIIIDSRADQARAASLLSSNFAGTALAGTPETDDDYGCGIVVAGEHFSSDDLPDADENCSNGSSTICLYRVDGATVFIESGDNSGLGIYPANAILRDYFRDWDFGGVEYAVGMAEFGFDDCYEEATEDDANVRVWVQPNYYGSTLGAPTANYAKDDNHDDLIFATCAEAQEWIDAQDAGIYCTAHGEAGRPAYTIVR